MKKLIVILLLFPLLLQAQMLDNSKGFAFTGNPFFNEQFIKQNRIKSISGHLQYKKKGDLIRASKYINQYKFDGNGKLIFSLQTELVGSIEDTVALYFQYDYRNNLSVLRQRSSQGYFSTRYIYNDKNQLIREDYYVDVDSTGDNVNNPHFERSTFINAEKYSYEVYPNFTKKTYYNNYDFPYMDETIVYNDLGLLEKTERTIKTTYRKTITTYEYNGKGWITKKTVTSESNQEMNEETQFHYDKIGNLVDEQVYKNGVHKRDLQIIYNSKTGLISYTIDHDLDTELITILKIDKVEYY